MMADQPLALWSEPGSSGVPFWADTDAQLYQRELEVLVENARHVPGSDR